MCVLRCPAALLALIAALVVSPAWADADAPAHEQLPDDRVLYIAPGQSLTLLVRRLYPEQAANWAEIRTWIVEHNPHAFANGNPDRMQAGKRVKLPSAARLAAIDPADMSDMGDGAGSSQATSAAAPIEFGKRYVFVDPAQSLSELVPKLYPQARAQWNAIIEAIAKRNEERLAELAAGDEIDRGTRLEIPDLTQPAAAQGEAEAPAAEPETAPKPPVVAQVIAHAGEVTATGQAGRERPLNTGDPVRRGDTLRTGDAGRAEILFRDDERLFLRADSRLRIRAWRLPETGPATRVLQLFKGALRAITGAIGNRDADTYRTITPQATLGVRGTEYAMRVCSEAECNVAEREGNLPAGLYVGVAAGRITLLNEAGQARVGAGELSFVGGPRQAPEAARSAVAALLFERTNWRGAEGDEAASKEDQDDDEPWWWAVVGAVLVGVAL
jgi:hypothetical protein